MDKYKQYVDLQWWHNIGKRDIENWIRNFGIDRNLAEIILDSVIFYNEAQLKAYTRFLVNKLKEQVYMSVMKENKDLKIDDVFLAEKWENYINETNFLPAALQNDSASSAYKIIGNWRSTLEHGDDLVSDIASIEKNYSEGIRRFILVDDFAGSGNQMLKVLKQKINFNNAEVELGRLPYIDNNIEIVIAVYVLHEKAKKVLNESYSKINLIYVDLISEDLNYMNKNSRIYEKMDMEKKMEVINAIKRINDNIMDGNEEYKKLSSYVLNIPIVFEHGCPNNTLLLLFAHSDNWQQLFKRGKEI